MTDVADDSPALYPLGLAQLGCMVAVVVIAFSHIPVHHIDFLGEGLGRELTVTSDGKLAYRAALAGAVLSGVQLVFLRRPRLGTARHRAAVVASLVAAFLGYAISILGACVGFFPDVPADMAPTVGIGAVAVMVAGLGFAVLASLRFVQLSRRRVTNRGRAGRALIFAAPGGVAALVVVAVVFNNRTEDWSPRPKCERPSVMRPAPLPGTWVLVSGVMTDSKGQVTLGGRDLALTIGPDKATWRFLFQEGWRQYDGTCRYDQSKDPKEIDLSQPDNPNTVARGIYRIEGDTLTISMDAQRPTSFDAPSLAKLVFRRE